MADGTFPRTARAYDPRESGGSQQDRREPASDPLLELARLIGQSDPFTPGPKSDGPRGGDMRSVPDYPSHPAHPDQFGADDYASGQDYRDPFPPRDSRDLRGPGIPRFPSPLPRIESYRSEESGYQEHADYQEHAGPDDHTLAPRHGGVDAALNFRPGAASAAPQHAFDPAESESGEYAAAAEAGEYQTEAEEDYDYEEEGHPEANRSGGKRRSTAKLALAVLGLAVFGSAGAYAYRTVFKGGTQGTPAYIRADASPTKVIPASTSGEANGKPINERLGGQAGERVVRRDEDPVDLLTLTRNAGASGSVVSGVGGPMAAAGAVPAAPPLVASPNTVSPNNLSEPRRVRTVSVRPEQGTAPPAAAKGAGGRAGAPLAISPGAMANAADSLPPTRAPSGAAAGSGHYMVQLTAQKSETEAQASFRDMQGKYAILNGQHSSIRRKDHGDGRVFYAAQVGPFGSKDEATKLCENLKSSGGTCFVQKN